MDPSPDLEKCPANPDLKIVQVRHPFERLLSAYRYIFKTEGWRQDLDYLDDLQADELYGKLFSKSWPQFVEDIIIQNQFKASDSDLRKFVYILSKCSKYLK